VAACRVDENAERTYIAENRLEMADCKIKYQVIDKEPCASVILILHII